jgi:DtxR family Mn-dependent transcriptional regulator
MFKLPFRETSAPAPRDELREMILLTLARAEETARALSPDDLARELNFAVAPHLQALIAQGLLRAEPSGALALTNAGRDRALTLLRRHRLAERLFTEVLGLDWAHAHEEADKLEHVVSAEGEQQLANQLGEPETCPHGNPIPPARVDRERAPLASLADCAPQTCATIARIALETPAALRHLATLGLLPDVQVVIENKAPFDGPLMLRVGRAHYALGRDLAARIWVRTSN